MKNNNVYSEINFHINWHVKGNYPVLRDKIEERIHRYITHRVVNTPQAILRAIGGTDDHIHLAISVQPTLLMSDWIGQIKGSTSHYINFEIAKRRVLQWQEGYGIVCFRDEEMEKVVRYVENQREHHAKGTLIDVFERSNGS